MRALFSSSSSPSAELVLPHREVGELVLDHLEGRAAGQQRTRGGVEEALAGELGGLLLLQHLGVVLGVGEEELLVVVLGVLVALELGGDLLRARHVDREAAVGGGVLLHLG